MAADTVPFGTSDLWYQCGTQAVESNTVPCGTSDRHIPLITKLVTQYCAIINPCCNTVSVTGVRSNSHRQGISRCQLPYHNRCPRMRSTYRNHVVAASRSFNVGVSKLRSFLRILSLQLSYGVTARVWSSRL